MKEHRTNLSRVFLSAFLVPVVFILVMYVFTGVFPFGPKTVVTGDMLNQYVAITSFMKRAFLHPLMLLYTNQSGLGINAWPMFAYYGTSPLTWLALLFPAAYLPIYFELNILLSTGLISLTTCWMLIKSNWLNHFSNSKNGHQYWVPLTLSTLFALSGYFTSYATCTMWLNAIILFPVVLLGWERVLSQQKTWLYLISLTCLIFVNYYIGVIVLEFLFLISLCWVLYQLLQRQFNMTQLKKAGKLVVFTLLAILNNLVILLPSFIAQKQVNQAKFALSLQKMMSISQLGTNFIPFHAKGVLVPLMYGGILVTLLAVAYFFTQVAWQEKLTMAILIFVLLLSTIVQALYMAWHSFSMPNGFPQREAFVIIFTLMLLAYRVWIVKQDNLAWKAILSSTIILAIVGIVLSIKTPGISKLSIICSIAAIVIAGSLTYLVIIKPRLSWLLLVFTLIDMGISDWPNYQMSSSEALSWRPFARYVQSTSSVIKHLPADSSHYRLASNAQFNMNDPLLFGYAGVSGYVSQLPTSESDYISQLGYYQKHSWYRWSDYNNGSTLAINRLMGFKYYLALRNQQLLLKNSRNEFLVNNKSIKYLPNKREKLHDYTIATDPNAATMIVSSRPQIFDDHTVNYNPNGNPFEYFNQLLAETTGNRVYQSLSAKPIKQSHTYQEYQLSSDGRLTYLYLPSPADRLLKGLKIKVNGHLITSAFGKDIEAENGIICLGQYPSNQQLTISLSGRGANEISKPVFASEQSPRLGNEDNIQKLTINANRIKWETTKNNHQSSMLITLAYNEGWHAKVDGNKVAVQPAAGGLMGIKLPSAGHHEIQMTYRPPKLVLGLLVTLVSLAVSILWIIISKRNTERKELTQ